MSGFEIFGLIILGVFLLTLFIWICLKVPVLGDLIEAVFEIIGAFLKD